MTGGMSTNQRRYWRSRIREEAEREMEEAIRTRLTRGTSEICVQNSHDGCTRPDCLCRCHDGEEDHPEVTHRCRVCGVGVRPVIGTMMPDGTWEHIAQPTDHTALPVKKQTGLER